MTFGRGASVLRMTTLAVVIRSGACFGGPAKDPGWHSEILRSSQSLSPQDDIWSRTSVLRMTFGREASGIPDNRHSRLLSGAAHALVGQRRIPVGIARSFGLRRASVLRMTFDRRASVLRMTFDRRSSVLRMTFGREASGIPDDRHSRLSS